MFSSFSLLIVKYHSVYLRARQIYFCIFCHASWKTFNFHRSLRRQIRCILEVCVLVAKQVATCKRLHLQSAVSLIELHRRGYACDFERQETVYSIVCFCWCCLSKIDALIIYVLHNLSSATFFLSREVNCVQTDEQSGINRQMIATHSTLCKMLKWMVCVLIVNVHSCIDVCKNSKNLRKHCKWRWR